ncbi:MAG: hypothetical protein FCO83_01325, partial [Spiroplasma sp. WSS]
MKVINDSVSDEILMNGYQKFCYFFSKILLVILLFPFVYFYSKKYQKQFFKFCFTYQKEGNVKINDDQLVDINSFDYHYYAVSYTH